MNHPDLCRKFGPLKHDIADFANEFQTMIQWRDDGTDSLLDIGCAGGDVTVDVLKPILPKTFSRLVGVDGSEAMVKYAKRNFQTSNVTFDILDITSESDVLQFKSKYNTFDHIHCSTTLNRIQDQRTAFKNFHKLLTPNGDCILYIVAEALIFEAFRRVDKIKWFEWLKHIDDFISPYSQHCFPEEILRKHLVDAGFTHCVIKERHTTAVYEDIHDFKGAYEFINFHSSFLIQNIH